jgi:acyl dehydratase
MHRTNRTHTTNSKATVAETEDDNASSTIHGTIPMHGKGLKMGQYAQVHRTFTQEDVNLFGRLSGDMNPVHFPPSTTTTLSSTTSPTTATAATTSNNDEKLPIVHGILLSSLFSNIFGNLIPGAIYRHQSLKFHNAVRVNEDVVGRVVVTKLRQINRKGRGSGGGVLCVCDTSVIKMGVVAQKFDNTTNDGNSNNPNDKGSNEEEKEEIVCISGDAQVWLPDLQLV